MHPTRKVRCGRSARDYVNAMSDPRLQDQMLQNRQRYDPQYQDLQMSLARRAADPMAQLAEQQAMRSQEFGSQMAERQAGSDMSLMNRFGADMTAAVRASDPLMQARVNQANELANQAYRESQMTDLSPEMRRRATQSAREGLVSRGRDMDNVGIAAEAMSREDYLRDIIRENRNQAHAAWQLCYARQPSNLIRSTPNLLVVDKTSSSKAMANEPPCLDYHRNQSPELIPMLE